MNKTANQVSIKKKLFAVAVIHLALVGAYIAQIIAYDAGKLITPEALLERWGAAAALAVVSIVILYLSKSNQLSLRRQQAFVWIFVVADILFAAFNVYTQRGMASRAVILFILPLLVISLLYSRIALFTTAVLCIAAYTLAAVAYFVNYFNEGYKIELYGEILFYSTVFLIPAALLWNAVKPNR